MGVADNYMDIMSFITVFSIFFVGFVSLPIFHGEDGIFSEVDSMGLQYAESISSVSGDLKTDGIFNFNISTEEDLGRSLTWMEIIANMGKSAINGVDYLVTMGLGIILWVAKVVAMAVFAVELMIRPLYILFSIFGVGAYFSEVAKYFVLAITFLMGLNFVYFAIMLWKGVK